MSARGQDRSNGVPTPTVTQHAKPPQPKLTPARLVLLTPWNGARAQRPALAVHSRGENLHSNRSSSQLAASAGLHQLSGAHGKPKAQWTPARAPPNTPRCTTSVSRGLPYHASVLILPLTMGVITHSTRTQLTATRVAASLAHASLRWAYCPVLR